MLVLGMHRSGTSAATGLVRLLGPATCAPGDMVRGPWNPSGHFESRSLMHLNNALLAEMGRRWWYPPPAGERYHDVAGALTTTPARARRVFRRVHRQEPWVWKDPRTCVLLPFWRQALGSRMAAVVVFRHPLEVAESLQRRHDLPVSFGLALWERYNRLALAHAESMPVFVSGYDELVRDPVGWTGSVGAFLDGLGMRVGPQPDPGDVARFVDPELRHSTHGPEALDQAPEAAATVYDALDTARGVSHEFVSPDLGPEPAGIEAELATLGAEHEPSWRPPPWAAGHEAEAADGPGTG